MKSYRYRGLEYPCALVKWVNGKQLKVLSYYETYCHDAGDRVKTKRWITTDLIGREIYYGTKCQIDYRNGPDGHRPLEHFWPHRPNRKWVKEWLWEKHGDKLVAKSMNRSLWPVVSDLVKLDRNTSLQYDEMNAYHAPSECGDLIAKGAQNKRKSILKSHGWGEMTLEKVIAQRVCQKWMYQHGLLYI